MLNTFPITEIRRPDYLSGRAFASNNMTMCLLDRTGSIYTSSVNTMGSNTIVFTSAITTNDVFLWGQTNGVKWSTIDMTGKPSNASGSFSTGMGIDSQGASYSKMYNKVLFTNHSTAYAFDWNTTYLTGSTSYITCSFAATRPQYLNSAYTGKGYLFAGSSAGSNSVGGVIYQWNIGNGSFRYLNCSASLSNNRASNPVYDVRRDVIWTACNKYIYAHNVETGRLIESRSMASMEVGNLVAMVYHSKLDELWIGNFGNTNIQKYNLTTNKSSSMTLAGFAMDIMGGIEKLT